MVLMKLKTNLECSTETKDTVIGLPGGQTLDGLLDHVAFFGDQIIGPRHHQESFYQSRLPDRFGGSINKQWQPS